MSRTRKELDTMLEALSQSLPDILAAHPDDTDFWPEFAEQADEIAGNAGRADYEHVRAQLDNMLAANGLIESEGRMPRALARVG